MALEMGMDRIAAHLKMDRMELRRRNFIGPHEFPYTIPSGSTYDSGDYGAVVDKAMARIDFPGLMRRRDELRGQGRLAGIGISTCLEPSRSEEHTSELQSLMRISYAVFCLKKKKITTPHDNTSRTNT